MIQVQKVISDSDIKRFVKFPFKLYKNSKYWVPPIINEEINIFKPNVNPTLKNANISLFIAKENNKIVGRIACV